MGGIQKTKNHTRVAGIKTLNQTYNLLCLKNLYFHIVQALEKEKRGVTDMIIGEKKMRIIMVLSDTTAALKKL
jgi:hypothetical protein